MEAYSSFLSKHSEPRFWSSLLLLPTQRPFDWESAALVVGLLLTALGISWVLGNSLAAAGYYNRNFGSKLIETVR